MSANGVSPQGEKRKPASTRLGGVRGRVRFKGVLPPPLIVDASTADENTAAVTAQLELERNREVTNG
jgi:hypothetical protein